MHDSGASEILTFNYQLNYTNNMGLVYLGGCVMG